jgi:hypothetical protein
MILSSVGDKMGISACLGVVPSMEGEPSGTILRWRLSIKAELSFARPWILHISQVECQTKNIIRGWGVGLRRDE